MSNINVVIADDNERIRQNLQEIVSRECDMTLVGSASDGMDALSMIRTNHPDVVLLDIIMPKMDGLGVLEEVKKDENLLKKPAFIILTAMGQEEVMEKRVYEVGDIVKLKKQHPCGSSEWEILRVGADFRLKCTGCGHQIMIARKLVEKNTKEIRKKA